MSSTFLPHGKYGLPYFPEFFPPVLSMRCQLDSETIETLITTSIIVSEMSFVFYILGTIFNFDKLGSVQGIRSLEDLLQHKEKTNHLVHFGKNGRFYL